LYAPTVPLGRGLARIAGCGDAVDKTCTESGMKTVNIRTVMK
jgi:hypothetical protein